MSADFEVLDYLRAQELERRGMAHTIVDLDKLAAAREATEAAQEAATVAAGKVAEALAIFGKPGRPDRIAITFRIKADTYELLRQRAFGLRQSQQALIDQALERFLAEPGS